MRFYSLVFFTFFGFAGLAQNNKDVVVTIGGQPVSKEEFEANYRKNNTNTQDEGDKKTPAQYLDMFISYKLKVIEAQALGYDTMRAFVDELKGYRDELARPYLTEVSYTDEMIRTAYHRTLYQRKVSHILIHCAQDASPADTLAAWNKLVDIRKQILDGADFNEMASKYSEDPSAKSNKGEIGYFGAFQMVYPFENMAYKTPVGQVSQILRSRFGFHILKVEDEREDPGEMQVAHIMFMFPKQASEETIFSLKTRADSVMNLLKSGANFAETAKKYSQDKSSAPAGGEMDAWISPTSFGVKAFSDAAFELKNDGDISPVIRTEYGWHIIKRLKLRKTPPFEEMKPMLEEKIRNDEQISKYHDDLFEAKLRKEYNLKVNDENFKRISEIVADTTLNADLKSRLQPHNETVLLTFADQAITVADFTPFLVLQHVDPKAKITAKRIQPLFDIFTRQEIMKYEDSSLEKKHPDFARLINEYHDGILLFNISKDKIWDVAASDTVKLRKYYAGNSKKYFWNERFKGFVLTAKNLEIKSRVEGMLDQKEMTKTELNDLFNPNKSNDLQIIEVAVEKGDNPIVDYFIWNGPKPAGFDETTTFVSGKKVAKEQKTLNDAWGLYSSDFQDQLEKEWIASLRKKYPVKVNKKLLKEIPKI